MMWRISKFKIAHLDGTTREVEGLVNGNLGVWANNGDCVQVTHLKSGKRVSCAFREFLPALRFAEAIDSLGTWDQEAPVSTREGLTLAQLVKGAEPASESAFL